MAMPAARSGNLTSVCISTKPYPHGKGIIVGLYGSGVEICDLPAATISSLVDCACPLVPVLHTIEQGSATVFIRGNMAARIFDETTHGGFIVDGEESVLIGVYAGVAAAVVWPGKQKFGNCGVQSCKQIIHQMTGADYEEEPLLKYAIKHGWVISDPILSNQGGIHPFDMRKMLDHFNIDSFVYSAPSLSVLDSDFAVTLRINKGIIISLNADILWGKSPITCSPHAVLITEGEFDGQGNLTHVYINDTGAGEQGRRVTIALLEQARLGMVTFIGEPYPMVVTNWGIWARRTPPPPLKLLNDLSN